MSRSLITFGYLILTTGCVEPFSGSEIQFTLTNVLPPCQVLAANNLPEAKKCSGKPEEDRLLFHYELWATMRKSAIAYLASFTVQTALFPEEQLQLEKSQARLSNGQLFKVGATKGYYESSPEEQAVMKTRMAKAVEAALAITSYSSTKFRPDSPNQLADDFYLGNYVRLTAPYNGTFFGAVEGPGPYGSQTYSGGSLFVAPNLVDLDSMMITIESADPNRTKHTPSDIVYLVGMAFKKTRGVTNVLAASPFDPSVTATFGVVPALNNEEYF